MRPGLKADVFLNPDIIRAFSLTDNHMPLAMV
jgi:hypothetical protein